MDIVKICQKCNVQLSLSDFNKNKLREDGLQAYCKMCNKEYREENKAKLVEYRKDYAKANKAKLAEYHKAYREENKAKLAIARKDYRTVNKVRISAYGKDYNEANRERIAEYTKAYYLENKSKLTDYQKEYYEANPSKYSARSAKRRSIKLKATPNWLTEDHFKQIEEFYLQAQILDVITGIKHHVDHIVPLQGKTVCGLHVPWNLQVLTAAENASKSNKLQT